MAVGFPMLDTLFPILSFFLRKKILERSFFLRRFRESSSSKDGLQRNNGLIKRTIEKLQKCFQNITRLVEIPLGTIAAKVCCYDGQLKDAGAQCGPQGQYLSAGPQC